MNMLLNLVILRIPGLKPAERNLLCNEFRDETDPVRITKDAVEAIVKHPVACKMKNIIAEAERDYKTVMRNGIKMVTLDDNDYPPLLREIYDPPHLLFYRGILPNPEQPLAAMVGTRQPSSAAAAMAYELGRDLGRNGVAVVSGLALGIDALSHRGNIDAGAPTVAVLGSGVDQIYPAVNRGLARQILEKGGAILSELPPLMGPRKWHFPARNRIISALARGTIIIEAPAKSGALITASFALEQGRDLWVSSAGLTSPKGAGTAKLRDEGAKVIGSAAEILAEWGFIQKVTCASESGIGPDQSRTASSMATGSSLASSLAKKLKVEI